MLIAGTKPGDRWYRERLLLTSNLKAIEKNLRKALDQSNCVILDSRRMKGIPDHAIERELQACAAGRIKNLKRLLFVNRKAQVIDIK